MINNLINLCHTKSEEKKIWDKHRNLGNSKRKLLDINELIYGKNFTFIFLFFSLENIFKGKSDIFKDIPNKNLSYQCLCKELPTKIAIQPASWILFS